MDLTRRRVLIGLGGAATTAGAMAEAISQKLAATVPPSTTSGWRASLVGIGAAYVQQHLELPEGPAKTGPVNHGLQQLAVERQRAETLLASGGGQQFRVAVRDDFDRGRTAEVGGWVLSVTEVAVSLVAWGEEPNRLPSAGDVIP